MPCSEAMRFFTDSRAEHRVDGDVLADVSQEVEEAHLAGPVPVVDQRAARCAAGQVDDAGDLGLDGGHVVGERLLVEEVALLGAAAGVADHAGGAADQGHGPVAGLLEAAQHQQPEQVADVEAVGGGIAAVVER